MRAVFVDREFLENHRDEKVDEQVLPDEHDENEKSSHPRAHETHDRLHGLHPFARQQDENSNHPWHAVIEVEGGFLLQTLIANLPWAVLRRISALDRVDATKELHAQ